MSKKQKKVLLRIVFSLTLCVIAYILPFKGILKLIGFLVPYLIIGWDVLYKAFLNICKGQVFDENFLMSIATLGAFAIGEYPEAAAVMLFYQVGELFQSVAVGKSRKSIAALMDIKPETATVLREGKELTVSPEEVRLGETIVVKAGEKLPLDGIILTGNALLDTASLTGESLPQEKAAGDTVLSGSVNLNGLITVKVTYEYFDSTVAKILELTENAIDKKATTEKFITRFARYYTPIVVLTALGLALIPPIFSGELFEWVRRTLIFLVVSCPCALVVSVPLTFFGGIGGASKKGILVKGAASFEKLEKADTFCFDKTGTLTKGNFAISEVYAENISREELLKIAASAESGSNHPIARCIAASTDFVKEEYIVTSVKEISGMGIEATINGQKYFLGNTKLMQAANAEFKGCENFATAVYVSRESIYLGYIAISDEVKENVSLALEKLKKLRVKKTVMLTGDNHIIAEKVAKEIGIDTCFSKLLPDGKVEAVEKLKAENSFTAFVGDGINDAPVLALADVGIAMGGLGSDAAIEAADIVIMDDDIEKLPLALALSRKLMRIVRQNIIFALAVKGIILVLGALGIANMWLAVFGDVGVTVIAVLNAMRTLK